MIDFTLNIILTISIHLVLRLRVSRIRFVRIPGGIFFWQRKTMSSTVCKPVYPKEERPEPITDQPASHKREGLPPLKVLSIFATISLNKIWVLCPGSDKW